jgi:hypothetical protein
VGSALREGSVILAASESSRGRNLPSPKHRHPSAGDIRPPARPSCCSACGADGGNCATCTDERAYFNSTFLDGLNAQYPEVQHTAVEISSSTATLLRALSITWRGSDASDHTGTHLIPLRRLIGALNAGVLSPESLFGILRDNVSRCSELVKFGEVYFFVMLLLYLAVRSSV